MLSDIVIDAAQNILRAQFKVNGLQDTVLGEKLMFREEKETFAQLLHNGSYHWVLVSNYNCEEGHIDYFDSHFHGRIKDHVKLQICNLYKSGNDNITVNVRMCQQQSNGVDCGLYAVYNAYSLLKGEDISSQKIDERKLRSHFLQCVGNGRFSQPPITVYCDEKIINVETFCVCKMAWAWYHNKNKGLNMAQCERCNKWFHRKCENIPNNVFTKQKTKWNRPFYR